MKKYKASQYNIITKSSDGGMLLTNNLYNVHLKIDSEDTEKIESYLNGLEYDQNAQDSEWFELLAEKKVLVPGDTNEKQLVDYYCKSMVYSDEVLHLTIIPTDACNFRCKYCYQSGPKHWMDIEVVGSIKKFLKKAAKKYRGIFISWYGGEPTLAKDIVLEIMSYAKKVCHENGIPLYGQMTTNGYALNKELFEELVKNHVLSYMVTIDGIKESHNEQRPHFSDKDSYTTILNNLKAIRDGINKNNFRIGVRINISPTILPFLEEYINIMGNEFGNDQRFGIIWEWVKDWGGENICNNYELVMDSYDSTNYQKYLDYITEKGLQIDLGQAMSRRGSEMCIASRKNGFVINYDGKIYKCAMAIYDDSIEEINCVGKVTLDGNIEIDDYKNSIWVGQGQISLECEKCKHYPECMGLLCPLATKVRNIFLCPNTLNKDQEYIARNMELLGVYSKIEKYN